jgi:hypothetical protein
MRVIGRLIALSIGLLVAAAGAGAVAARAAKERIVRHDDPAADEVAVVAIFEPLAFTSTATGFRGGTLDCWYGGGIFDLREATLDPAGATLRVRAVFGGGQIVVPDGWVVETRVSGLGGIGDARPAIDRAIDAPRLLIEGGVLFGGFGVSSSVPEDADRWMRRPGSAPTGAEAPSAEPVPVLSN